MYIRRRSFVLVISFLLFLAVIMGGFYFIEAKENDGAVSREGYGYQNDIVDFAYAMNNISTGLKKAEFAATPYRLAAIASDLLAQAERARAALSSLPTYGLMLSKTNEFLSRVGDYSFYLTRKAINGEEITEEEKANLESLSEAAATLAAKTEEIELSVTEDNMGLDTISDMFSVPDGYWEQVSAASVGSPVPEFPNEFLAMEGVFSQSGFNYDGLYSDHLKSQTSAFLDSKEAVTEREALEKAAVVIGCPQDELSLVGDVGTKMTKCYVFTHDISDSTLYITKQGGYLYSYLYGGDKPFADEVISETDAVSSAEAFLSKCGYSNCDRAYWQYQDNILILTYVALYDGVRVYSEEIKVGVSLADGEVVYCDASGLLLSGKAEKKIDFEEELSPEEAAGYLSSRLNVKSVERAIIKSPGGRDISCYEILCSDGEVDVVVYINAETGAEEDSFILTEDESGYWVK